MAGNGDNSMADNSYINATFASMSDSITDGSVTTQPTDDELREQVRIGQCIFLTNVDVNVCFK